jgi:hypothetical protein
MTPVDVKIQRRAARLARGLRSVGVRPDHTVAVLCCADHQEDRLVALAALRSLGASAVEVADWGACTIGSLGAEKGVPSVQLACEEGVAAWRAGEGRGIMIGEGEGVVWWKALECRFNQAGPPRHGREC